MLLENIFTQKKFLFFFRKIFPDLRDLRDFYRRFLWGFLWKIFKLILMKKLTFSKADFKLRFKTLISNFSESP